MFYGINTQYGENLFSDVKHKINICAYPIMFQVPDPLGRL